MLASWRSEASCAPHDHGHARGLVVVLDGEFTETVYAVTRRGLTTTALHAHSAGAVLRVGGGLVHAMRCHRGGTTLHVYVPGVHSMRVYDVVAQATLVVADGCGAWVPQNSELVVHRLPWDSGHEGATVRR